VIPLRAALNSPEAQKLHEKGKSQSPRGTLDPTPAHCGGSADGQTVITLFGMSLVALPEFWHFPGYCHSNFLFELCFQ